mgnify:CR=1 FL=1
MTEPAFRTVWITGASTGIGRALALRLARDGSTVVASARSADRLAELAEEAPAGRILARPLDVTDADAVAETWRGIVADLGVPDLCIMNAGTHVPVDGTAPKAADFRALMDINFMGVVNVLERAVPEMVARGSGRLAVVSSVAGYRGLRTAAAYGATKAALINMCESLRMELIGRGVIVQVVNPGFVDTPLTEGNRFPMPFLMPVDRAADRFYAGLRTDRFEITFPKRFTWILKVMRCLPYAVYLPLVGRLTKPRA